MGRIAGIVGIALVVSVVAAILVPVGNPHPIHNSELLAAARLRSIPSAQMRFRRGDYYGTGEKLYANPKNGNGSADLHSLPDGSVLKLIDENLADALRTGAPARGYVYRDVPCPDYHKHFAVCAVPAEYGKTGYHVFYVSESGTVYQLDPLKVYPNLKKGDRVMPVTARLEYDVLDRDWESQF